MAVDDTATTAPAGPAGWRFKVGVGLFALMILLWLLIPIEAALGMSAGAIAATTAGIAIANKVILLIAIAVMGKAGFQELKGRAFGHVKHLAPAATVSPARYAIGLAMFCLPLLQGLLETWVDLVMDAMLIASVFVLGGNFWDKLRALFVREARAAFPEDTTLPVGAPTKAEMRAV